MINRINGLLIGMLFFGVLSAQSPTEWISYNQTYIKLKIAEDGWYRVTSSELQSAGFPVTSVSASQIQLFRLGEEVAIRTETSSGGSTLDYFEFWGEKNTGISDEELYLPNAQPHTDYSLFSDTATYFVTWTSSSNHSRIINNTQNDNAGLIPVTVHYQKEKVIQADEYATGRLFGGSDNNDFQLSDYDFGEGWTGPRVSKGSSETFTFDITEQDENTDSLELEIIAVGRNSLQHVVTVSAGPETASLSEIDTFTFVGYTSYKHLMKIDWSQVNTDGTLVIQCTVTGVEGATDYVSFSKVTLSYPQTMTLSSEDVRAFDIKSQGTERLYLQVTSASPDSYTFYDVSNPFEVLRLPQNSFSDRSDVILPDALQDKKVIGVSGFLTVPGISAYEFEEISLVGSNYLIITHPLLRNHPDGSDPIEMYEQYRSSEVGGGYEVVVAEIDDVYDQYNYGDPSVLAIRRLFAESYDHGIENVLILAKGRTINQNIFRNQYADLDSLDKSPIMVPTYGIPGGDNPFSIGLNPSQPLIPVLPTGRVNAWKPEHVTNYLNKVKEMESLPYDQLWRKHLIQLSGGTSTIELNSFANNIDEFKEIAEGDFLGGRALNQYKKTSATSEKFNIEDEVNNGVGYVTLFGHSSNSVSDVDIGRPSNEAFRYDNNGRYPIIIVNGCKAGEIFGDTESFGEDWISFPEKGAVGFVAHADQASSTNLKRFTTLVYEIGFANADTYGYTIGEVLRETSEQFYMGSAGTGETSQTQVQQTLYQGDPAMFFFKPAKPDFQIVEENINAKSINDGQILAQEDSVLINIPIANYGRTTLDSLHLSIDRLLPDNSLLNYTRVVAAPKYLDTLKVYLTNPPEYDVEGPNQITITLDPSNKIYELNDLNNSAGFELFISAGSTQNLKPYDMAIVSSDSISLIWQSTNPFESSRGYLLEIDTVEGFGSPFFQSTVIQGKNLMLHPLEMSDFPDETVVYWRTRFAEIQADSDTIYQTSSFTYLPSSSQGWGQFSFDQFLRSEYNGLVLNEFKDLRFNSTTVPVSITTQGTGFFDYDQMKIVVDGADQLASVVASDPVCESNTFNALVFDKNSGQLIKPLDEGQPDYLDDLVCGRLPQKIYNFNTEDLFTDRRIEELIAKMGNGDQVVFFNIDSMSYSSFDDPIKEAFEEIGVNGTLWGSLIDGQPLVIFGVKGGDLGSARVVSSDESGLLPTQQTLSVTDDIIATDESGSIEFPVVGPSTKWEYLLVDYDAGDSDVLFIELSGMAVDGSIEGLASTDSYAKGDTLDLSFIDAYQFPYIHLAMSLRDEVDLTPPQIGHTQIIYDQGPEGVLIPVSTETQEVQEGEEVASEFNFINIGEGSYQDSLEVVYQLSNNDLDIFETSTQVFPPLEVFDTISLNYNRSSIGIAGSNNLRVSVDANQAEKVTINNQLTFGGFANVTTESINPLIDVTIDGRYILDGEIVSSEPLIHISYKDENPFLLKTDTTGIELTFKGPLDTQFEKISFANKDLTWSPASQNAPFEINYQPILSEDGVYTMKVQAEDESGNTAGDQPYEISFEVINKSTITHFYPYPNPFSTNCRFVFTLTGSEIPDNLRIQIMTISGRVVKTIDESEIGPIHIGNNITEYSWDGRDDYGDLLANGVYLYRVNVKSDIGEMERRNTLADKAFKQGVGKLYILR
jgi:hypothetical protein